MTNPTINPEKIIARLKFYDYRYRLIGTTLFVYLPWLCFLKIDFEKENVKITSHLSYALISRLEYNFPALAIITLFFTSLSTMDLYNKIMFYSAIAWVMAFYIICFIKTENMKAIIHNWIEKDS